MALPTKSAFQVLNASEWNAVIQEVNQDDEVQYNHSFSASSAIGTSATAILTITGAILRAGVAYQVENVGAVFGSVANEADFSLWKTSVATTQIGAFYRTPTNGGAQRNCYGKIYLRRTAVTDLTLDLVLAVAASTGTVAHDAAANRPRALVVRPVGPAAGFGFAFDVT